MCRNQKKKHLNANNSLDFCAWNIHGYQSRQIGPKFIDSDFLNQIQDIDLLGLTHIHDEILEELNIPGFTRISYKNREKNLRSGTASGGIAVFAKAHLANMFNAIKNNNTDSVWVKLKKEFTGEENDIFIGTWYISPHKGNEGNDKMEALCKEVISFQKKGHVIINGDLNAKTGDEEDFVIPDKYNDMSDIQHKETFRKRNSQDKTLNERGRLLLDMCKGLDLHIVNGRKTGDVFGEFTSIQWNGNSVVDYVLTAESLYDKILKFQVGEIFFGST